MAKANVALRDGTVVQIEGTVEEVQRILALYGHDNSSDAKKLVKPTTKKTDAKNDSIQSESKNRLSLTEIVNSITSCDNAERIETAILDRSSVVDRILLPLYITYKYFDRSATLTTGEISKILYELGIGISVANVSTYLAQSAKKYVQGDKMRKVGQAVKYRISRRGISYVEQVLGLSGDVNVNS